MRLLKDFKRLTPLTFLLSIAGCNPPNVHVALSGDGKMLAVVHKGGLWAGPFGQEKLIDRRQANNPLWSPDGSALAFEVPASFPKLAEDEPRTGTTIHVTRPDTGGVVVSMPGEPERPLPDMVAPFAWPSNDRVMGVLEAQYPHQLLLYWVRTYDLTALYALTYDIGNGRERIVRSFAGIQQKGSPFVESVNWSTTTGKLILTYKDRTELIDVPGLTGS